ncbi:MAG: autotransporter-associated beta strand repeat-containing protein [Kiritimatiellae bacterium]|nr:autotransporter-associated beta strand repeat-containing protein [Kiritimatiellia bacterium]
MRIIMSMLSATLCIAAYGAECTLHKTSDAVLDITDGSNYENSIAPQEKDILVIPEGVVVKVTAGSSSWNLLTTLSRVVPRKDSVLAITVPETFEGHAVLPVPVTEFNLEGADNSGTLVKDGAGVLELSACGIVTARKSDTTWSHDYDLNLKIEDGTIMLCQNPEVIIPKGINQFSLRRLEMEKDTIFFMPKSSTKTCSTRFMTIAGEGLITNAATYLVNLFLEEADGSVFGGTLAASDNYKDNLAVYVYGDWTLTNPNNAHGRSFNLYNSDLSKGVLSVSKVRGDAGTGHIYGSALNFKENGTVFRYLGAEGQSETVEKKIGIDCSELTIDGGAWGGLTFENLWDSTPTRMRKLTFTGSNVQEMVFHGYAKAATDEDGKRTFTDYVIKEGTGTWHFKYKYNNQMGGVFDVRNGILRFDKIEEAGKLCALGYADSLYNENTTTTLDEAHKADYAIVLGGAKTEGTLEYTGTAEGKCSTRNIAVRSKGRFISDSAKYTLANVYAMDGKSATFTLDGVRTDNVAKSLSDGKNGGSLSVVKEGSGTWTLTGTNEISGPLTVRSGVLNVENPGDRKYRWYRIWITQNAYGAPDKYDTSGYKEGAPKARLLIGEIAIYDAEGNNLVAGFKPKDPIAQISPDGDYSVMEAGEMALGRASGLNVSGAEKLFDGNSSKNYVSQITYDAAKDTGIKIDDQNTWVPIVVRVPDDAEPAARVDVAQYYPEGYGYNPTAIQVDASPDGRHWDAAILVASDFKFNGTYGAHWLSEEPGTAFEGGQRKGKGWEIEKFSFEGDLGLKFSCGGIGVSGGGELNFAHPYVVDRIIVDASKTAGSFSNVVLAETGTLEVTGYSDSDMTTLPVVLPDAATRKNLSKWTLMLNGKPSNRLVRADADGTLKVCPRGLLIRIK